MGTSFHSTETAFIKIISDRCLEQWAILSLQLILAGQETSDTVNHSFLNHLFHLRRRQWQPTPVLLPGKSHGRRSLVGCSPWGRKELDMTERLHFHFSLSCIGEGNGNPLQCSCLENPMDRGACGLPSMGSHRVGHDWRDLAAAVDKVQKNIRGQERHSSSSFLLMFTLSIFSESEKPESSPHKCSTIMLLSGIE